MIANSKINLTGPGRRRSPRGRLRSIGCRTSCVELAHGFAFVDGQHHLAVDGNDYRTDQRQLRIDAGNGSAASVGATDDEGTFAMTVDRGLLALLEAKPGKGAELADFLKQGRELAVAETGTVTWYAFKLTETTYGIFDTFEGEDGRQAHLNGQIPAALGQVGPDLLASDPDIRTTDILAVK